MASVPKFDRESLGQIVLVLQGGGALGAYHVGVYQALCEAGIEPDWVIGTSIGAINASLIAGNAAEQRLQRLAEFWRRVTHPPLSQLTAMTPLFGQWAAHMATISGGLSHFFQHYTLALLGLLPLGSERSGYYSTEPLERTLEEFVDPIRLNSGQPRLTVGAANVQTGEMHYFDSRECALTIRHVMASGALPPAFPAVRIDDELYWDGGILSNTPTEAIFDDVPRRDSLIFAVHMWNPIGPEPETIWEVLHRHKDIQYSSRVAGHIARQRQVHRLRHVVSELIKFIPEAQRDHPTVQDLAEYGCRTQMHVVRLLAPRLDHESHTKDVDFSAGGIRVRWE